MKKDNHSEAHKRISFIKRKPIGNLQENHKTEDSSRRRSVLWCTLPDLSDSSLRVSSLMSSGENGEFSWFPFMLLT